MWVIALARRFARFAGDTLQRRMLAIDIEF
jgi:hypothetical protein